MGSTLEVVAHDAHHIIGRWKNLAMAIWRHETQGPAVEAFHKLQANMAKEYSQGIALLQVVEENGLLPDGPTRAALAKMLREGAPYVKTSAIVHEGDGFKAAAVRGVVTSLTMLAKPAFPHKIYSTVDKALEWEVSQVPAVDSLRVGLAPTLGMFNSLRGELNRLTGTTS